MLFFGGKAKKERRSLIERHKKMFKMQLPEYRRKALAEGKTLRTVYEEQHFVMRTRQATNIITADRVGGGDKTRNLEIEDIRKREISAEEVFKHALDEFIAEVGEVERPAPAMQAEKSDVLKKAEETVSPQPPAVVKEPGEDANPPADKKD
jgi:hypothetical protein